MLVKRLFLLFTVMVLCFSLSGCFADAADETHGFGIVNAVQVAVRETPNGQKLYRVNKDQTVWINDTRMDARNEAWYQVSTLADNGRPVTGWMKAEFIDAGDALWNDVEKVSIGYTGAIALKKDGTALVARGDDWGENSRYFLDDAGKILTNCRDVKTGLHAGQFYAFTDDGTMHSYTDKKTEKYRLFDDARWAGITEDGLFGSMAEGFIVEWIWPAEKPTAQQMRQVDKLIDTGDFFVMKTEDHQVFCCTRANAMPEQIVLPDFSRIGDVRDIAAAIAYPYGFDYKHLNDNCMAVIAWADMNGAVTVMPADAAPGAASWTDVDQLCMTNEYLLGVKSDGTVVSTGLYGKKAPELSGWTDICYLDSFAGVSAGVKTDGTVAFDGSFDYSEYYTIK